MAFLHSKNTEVLVDGVDVSGYLNSFDTSTSVDSAETSTFKKNWKTYISGLASATVSAGGFYDPALTVVRSTLQTAKTLTAALAGASAAGDPVRMASVRSTSYAETAKLGDVVGFAWAALTDELSFGKMIHPLATEALDGATAAGVDMGTEANGAVCHLHVTGVSAGESVEVSLTDCDTLGGTYTAVTGGTFAVASAAGAQRLVIPGTLRRYVKANWDITDNGGTVAVEFAVALARL